MRYAREHRGAARLDDPAADSRGAGPQLPLALAEPPAGALVDALRDRDRRRRLLPARAADEARAPAGARGERPAGGSGGSAGLGRIETAATWSRLRRDQVA